MMLWHFEFVLKKWGKKRGKCQVLVRDLPELTKVTLFGFHLCIMFVSVSVWRGSCRPTTSWTRRFRESNTAATKLHTATSGRQNPRKVVDANAKSITLPLPSGKWSLLPCQSLNSFRSETGASTAIPHHVPPLFRPPSLRFLRRWRSFHSGGGAWNSAPVQIVL